MYCVKDREYSKKKYIEQKIDENEKKRACTQ